MVNHKTGDILYTANTNIDLLTFAKPKLGAIA